MVYHDDTKNTMWYTPSKVTLEYVFVLFAPSWFNLSSYRQGRLIVLYVGCTGEIIETLNGLMGPAIARGPGCN
jgi:hypothetical protein